MTLPVRTIPRVEIVPVSERDNPRLALAVAALCGLILLAHSWAYQDELDMERMKAERAERLRAAAEATLAEDRALHGLPNPAIVLDAENARRYGLRLSEIAGGLDAERAQIRRTK